MPLLAILIAYLLGSIPSGLLLTKFAGLGDVRNIGSGNIGATNVLRTGNKPLAALTLIFDILKGILAVWIAMQIAPPPPPVPAPGTAAYIAGLAAILGHIYPVWLNFKGGKGVATIFGVISALALGSGVIFAAVWLAVFWRWRYSSLASLSAMSAALFVVLFPIVPAGSNAAVFYALFWLLMVYTHRENIQRLRNGTEHCFSSAPRR